MTSNAQSAENPSASRTPKFSKDSVNNASIKAIKSIVENETTRRLKKKLAKYGIADREKKKLAMNQLLTVLSAHAEIEEALKTTEKEKINIEVRAPPRILDVRVLYLDKDGTNYDLLVIEIQGNFSFGSMSLHKHGYLVLEGLNRRAYIFHEFIPDGRYIAEKLSGGRDLTERDIENIMLLMKRGMKPKGLKTFQESVQDARNIYPCGER